MNLCTITVELLCSVLASYCVLPAVIDSVRGDVVPYAHLNGSQLPPAHTHAAPLSAELSSMLPSLLSEQTCLGLIKVLLYQI